MKKALFFILSAVLFMFSAAVSAELDQNMAVVEEGECAEISVLAEPADEAVSHVERLRTAHSADIVSINTRSEHNEAVPALIAGRRGDSPILRYDKAAA